MTPEQYLTKQIMIYCGNINWLCFHANVGKVQLADGRYFSTGLPPGFPDLIILTDTGKYIAVETKIHPRKPTQDQINFINNLNSRGFLAFVCYNLQEFIEKISDLI